MNIATSNVQRPSNRHEWPRQNCRQIWPLIGLAAVLFLGGAGVIFLKTNASGKHLVTFSFAGWTNDAFGQRAAALRISNVSPVTVKYMADRQSQPRCDCWALISRRKEGNRTFSVTSNLTDNLWSGLKIMELGPQQSVDCVVPWHGAFTNGQFTFNYLPPPNIIQRAGQTIEMALNNESSQPYLSVPLTGKPWRDAAGIRK